MGDLLQMSGGGGVYRETRERRQAVLTEYLGDRFNSLAPVNGGDSGGPIAHVDSGLALGTVSGLDFVTPGTLNGPTVSNIVAASASFGFPIRMRAAGEPPPAPPQPASPPPAGGPPPDQAQERPATKRKKRKACRKKARRGKRARRCRRR